MNIFLLIDTNIFITLLKNRRDEYLLDQLEKLVEKDVVKLLVPDALNKEWNKKGKQTTKDLKSKILDLNEILGGGYQDNYFEENENRITNLLNRGLKFKPDKKVKQEIGHRVLNDIPPFNSKKNNSQDASIFFTAISYLKKNNIKEYYFVTENIAEFGNPEKKNAELSSNLQDANIICHFYNSLGRLFHEKKNLFLQHTKEKNPDIYFQNPIIVVKEKSDDLLGYLYSVLKRTKEVISFCPLEIFCRIEPFKIADKVNNYSHYYNYTLLTNNSALLELFRGVELKDNTFKLGSIYKNTRINLSRLRFIIAELNRQLIFKIDHINGNKEIDLNSGLSLQSPAIIDNWLTLNWNKVLSDSSRNKKDTNTAQVLFFLGYFENAFRIYYSNYARAKQERKWLKAFKCLIELKNIQQFISHTPKEDIDKELKEIRSIDIEREYFRFSKSDRLEFEIAKFLRNGNNILYFKDLIRSSTDRIKECLDLHVKGGFSGNDHVGELLRDFNIFHNYTIWNSCTYIRFSEYQKIIEEYSLGIFLGISLRSYETSNIEYFNEDILQSLILWGKPDSLNKFHRAYVKKDIEYRSENTKLEQAILSHFFIYRKRRAIFSEKDKNFEFEFLRISWNIIFLVSITRFSEQFINNLFNLMGDFVISLPYENPRELQYLGTFCHRKSEILNNRNLKKIFYLAVEKSNIHNITFFAGISL